MIQTTSLPKESSEAAPTLDGAPFMTDKEVWAINAAHGVLGNAATMIAFSGSVLGPMSLDAATMALIDTTRAVAKNDFSAAENMLSSQAAALNAIFVELAQRAKANILSAPQHAERYLRLAFKAQTQCRSTWETLALIKNPTTAVFARQANITNGGRQQINIAAGAPQICDPAGAQGNSGRVELLGAVHEERLESAAPSTASRTDPQLAALGAIDGSQDTGRQGARGPQRRARNSGA